LTEKPGRVPPGDGDTPSDMFPPWYPAPCVRRTSLSVRTAWSVAHSNGRAEATAANLAPDLTGQPGRRSRDKFRSFRMQA